MTFEILGDGLMLKKNLVILQARMSSSRLPGKVLATINGRPMIYWQIMRIKMARKVDQIVVATSTDQSDDALVDSLQKQGFLVERGSLDNVLGRYLQIIEKFGEFENILRLTGDCPLLMPEIVDEVISEFEKLNLDYLSNALEPTFPDGLDIEIMKRTALLKLASKPLSMIEKEHVTLGFRGKVQDFSIGNYSQVSDLSHLRWTVDYQKDLEFVRRIYDEFRGRELTFGYQDLLALLEAKPELTNEISGNLRNVALKEKQQ
jgi:spore coat polysaccharide biosynthesis protein SpsF